MDTTRTRELAQKRVGTLLHGKWTLDRLLGIGGSAAVYAATHRNGKRGAVKILHPHCCDDDLRSRFLREGNVANKIGHSGAVTILDDDVTADGLVYLVMELLEGHSLERGRGDGRPMAWAEVVRVGDELLDVLAKAHAMGIIHRDVKPANLFLTDKGQLKVLDFGIARLTERSAAGDSKSNVPTTQNGLMMGTPAFMSPEQARARWNEVDARSDIWAVGVTLITLLMGRRPRVSKSPHEELLRAMTEAMPKVEDLIPNLPRSLADVLDKAVAFEPSQRWQTAQEMQDALRAAARESEPTLAAPPTLIQSSPRRRSGSLDEPGATTTLVIGSNANASPIVAPRTAITAVEDSQPQLPTAPVPMDDTAPLSGGKTLILSNATSQAGGNAPITARKRLPLQGPTPLSVGIAAGVILIGGLSIAAYLVTRPPPSSTIREQQPVASAALVSPKAAPSSPPAPSIPDPEPMPDPVASSAAVASIPPPPQPPPPPPPVPASTPSMSATTAVKPKASGSAAFFDSRF